MTATRTQLCLNTIPRDSVLPDADGAGGLEGNPEHDILPIADAALDAP
jgi:hypothetical protein